MTAWPSDLGCSVPWESAGTAAPPSRSASGKAKRRADLMGVTEAFPLLAARWPGHPVRLSRETLAMVASHTETVHHAAGSIFFDRLLLLRRPQDALAAALPAFVVPARPAVASSAAHAVEEDVA